jgi:RNA polymerase sigma-70 factor (ECF subfamily)
MNNLALVQNWNEATTTEAYSNNNNLFSELVESYSQDLQRYAHWLAGDKHTAEDLVQETLLRAWKSVDRLQNPKAAKGWLFTILRRENARRFERKQLEVSDIPLETLESNDNYYDTSTEAFVLRRAIEGLPEEYREPLVQQVVGGYSQKEIANHLGISSAGVGTRLFRARNKLKEVLAA